MLYLFLLMLCTTFLQFEHAINANMLFPDEPLNEKVEAVVRLTERHFPDLLQPTDTWTKLLCMFEEGSKA